MRNVTDDAISDVMMGRFILLAIMLFFIVRGLRSMPSLLLVGTEAGGKAFWSVALNGIGVVATWMLLEATL